MRQLEEYSRAGLNGYSLVNNTPLTLSAIVKMLPFIENGFNMRASTPSFLGRDPEAIKLVRDLGYDFDEDKKRCEGADLLLDCCAELKGVKSSKAVSELTRTGVHIYREEKVSVPVLSVDDSRLKALETFYGTSDGFIRAYKEFVSPEIKGKRCLLFGFGKVGKGIVRGLLDEGAVCTVVDTCAAALASPYGAAAKRLLASEIADIKPLLRDNDVLVTATGVDNFLSETPWAGEILASKIKLMNMGAADEFGPKFSEADVINGKKPINFRLKRPTLLKFLDPVFYAHNSLVALYHDGRLKPGLQPVPVEIDERLVKEWHEYWKADISLFNSVCPANI
jgi:adenosylhomocysteinase